VFAVSKNNPHRGGILTCAHMLPPSSQRKSSQKRDFDLGLHASHHLKNNPPKGRIPKRWDKNPVQEILPEGRIIDRILLIEGYLHVSTFSSVSPPPQAIDTQEGTQFTMELHPHSPGSSQRTGKTKWETALKEGPNPHFPWRDLEEWELVEWLVDQRLPQRSINDFIKNKWVCTSI